MPAGSTKAPRHSNTLVRQLRRKWPLGPQRGAEVGVWLGQNAEQLLKSFRSLHLVLVDRYQAYEEDDSTEAADSGLKNQNAMDAVKVLARNRLDDYRDRIVWRLCASAKAAELQSLEEKLDFVFIDAHHAYESVLADMSLWWPHVKQHGVLCGHDYKWHRTRGVKQAVDEFVAVHELGLKLLGRTVWWIDKP